MNFNHGCVERERTSHRRLCCLQAVTALYASAERESKKSRMQSRQLLVQDSFFLILFGISFLIGISRGVRYMPLLQERQFQWVLREYGNQETIPTRALLNYLQIEAQVFSEWHLDNEMHLHVPVSVCIL